MKAQFNFLTIVSIIVAVVFAYLFFTNNKPNQLAGMPPPGNIPADTQVLLAFTKAGKFFPADKDGNPLKPCQLCDEGQAGKFGKKCENAPPQANICHSLVNATIRSQNVVTFTESVVNPECGTMWIHNTPYPWPPGCGS